MKYKTIHSRIGVLQLIASTTKTWLSLHHGLFACPFIHFVLVCNYHELAATMQLTVFTTIIHIFIFIQECRAVLNLNAKSNVALYWVSHSMKSM